MIEVLQPGMFTTVQDLGRDGLTHLGISPSGAADAVALRIGNWLVGNPPGAAALEMTLLGGSYHFESRSLVALTGRWNSFEIGAGEVLDIGPLEFGARAYLCVSGGIGVPEVFGSRSTHVLSRLGGLEGRALRRGDKLPAGPAASLAPRTLPERFLALTERTRTLRITPGAQARAFSAESAMRLIASEYTVRDNSDRMGVRFSGPPVCWRGEEMRSEGVPLGAIQIPPDGEPIALGVDAQTTGGYPVIGAVITADLPSLGQLRPRDRVRFHPVSFEEARALALQQDALLRELV
jgi:antagonist of KipI